jgi:hypothetical protein
LPAEFRKISGILELPGGTSIGAELVVWKGLEPWSSKSCTGGSSQSFSPIAEAGWYWYWKHSRNCGFIEFLVSMIGQPGADCMPSNSFESS